MKLINIIAVLLSLIVVVTSCEDFESPVMPKSETAAGILVPNGTTSYYLQTENNNGAFETFLWEEAYFGNDEEITYQVQLDAATGDFTNPATLESTTKLYQTITVAEMNQICRDLGIEADQGAGLQVRIMAVSGTEEKMSIPVSMLVRRYIYEDEIIVWGIVGSAVNPDDEAEHLPFQYDEENDKWKATLLLNSGTFVFQDKSYRKTTLGSDGSELGLEEGGAEISVDNLVYSIELDVTNLTYTIEESSFPNNLYLVGYHNGWDEITTASPHKNFFNGTYEVYQNFAEGLDGYECKWLPQLGSWDGDMGDDPDNPGTIISDGEININLGTAGFYYIKADLATMTWEAKATTWGIIGNATPGFWDAQTNFDNFDAISNTFTMTENLTAGELKFRGTDDWSVNYGGEGLSGEPIPGGSNIVIIEEGTYDITLVLGHEGTYSYSIVKQ